MDGSLGILARLDQFVVALLPYWWLLMPGGVFAIEPMIEGLLRKSWKEAVNSWWPKKARQQHFKWAAVAALFIACFLAFDDVNTANQKLQTKLTEQTSNPVQQATIDRLSGDLTAARGQIDAQKRQIHEQQTELTSLSATYAHRRLSAQQKEAISRVIEKTGEKHSIAVFQPNDCNDCNEYASDFIETLTAPTIGWKLTLFTTMMGGVNPHFRGVALLVDDPKKPTRAALVLAGALIAAKVKFEGGPAKGFDVPKDGVGLLIGPKAGQ